MKYEDYIFDKQDLNLCLRQCEIQDALSPGQINGMIEAYKDAKMFALGGNFQIKAIQIELVIIDWAKTIETIVNANGYRTYGVRVGNDIKLHWQQIPRSMDIWCRAYTDSIRQGISKKANTLSPTELYYEFEQIHPFGDGNGRIGHLIWAVAQTSVNGIWPITLPPNVFGDPRIMDRESAIINAEDRFSIFNGV